MYIKKALKSKKPIPFVKNVIDFKAEMDDLTLKVFEKN